MLEPSFALVKRHQTDQHRIEAENELKLQNQLNQFWQKIGSLERHAKQSDAERATLSQRLQKVEAESTALKGRLKELEGAGWATERSSVSPETAASLTGATPNVIARGQDNALVDALNSELEPTTLHSMLPKLLFVLNPVGNVLSDGSEFPLSMISSLRSILAETLDDEYVEARQIRRLNIVARNPFTTQQKCLYRHLQTLTSGVGGKSVWTKQHQHLYACRTCVNKRRLCITIARGQLLMLPLHPLFRIVSRDDKVLSGDTSSSCNSGTEVLPTELQYWVVARDMLTKYAPYNADIWSVPSGHY